MADQRNEGDKKTRRRISAEPTLARPQWIPSWLFFLLGIISTIYTPYGFFFLFISSTSFNLIYYPLALLYTSTIGSSLSDVAKVETAFFPILINVVIIAVLALRRRRGQRQGVRYAWYLTLLTLTNMATVIALLIIFSTCHGIQNTFNGYCGGFPYV